MKSQNGEVVIYTKTHRQVECTSCLLFVEDASAHVREYPSHVVLGTIVTSAVYEMRKA